MSRIGRYEIEKEIGRGAMGVVYSAHDPRLKRRVAVKVFSLSGPMNGLDGEEHKQRFMREAHAAGRLSHPGIVTIYDVDDDPRRGSPFIAMEYIQGRSLRDVLRAERRLEPERALAVADSVASALQAAHEAGIIHRDVKPANILVRDSDGAVKITDFGVARLAASDLTRSGDVFGTPSYMSPEQIRDGKIDGRSDLFSLAVVLYETLCGGKPFEAEDVPALVYSIAHSAPVPITRRAARLPLRLDDFFTRALAKDAAGRYSDGEAFRCALRDAVRGQPLAHRPTARLASAAAENPAHPGASPEGAIELGRSNDPSEPPLGEPSLSPGWPSRFLGARAVRRAVLAAALLTGLVLGGWALLGGNRQAYLKLDAKSSVEAGTLILLLDGQDVYTRRLSAPTKKSKGLLGKVLGKSQETFEAWIEVPPGKHEVVARVESEAGALDYQGAIVIDLEPGETQRLRMVAGRAVGAPLSLKAD